MAKYNYDKSVLKGLGVGAFLGQVKERENQIAKGENKIPTSVYNPNVLASKLHPEAQHCFVAEVIGQHNAKTFILVPDESKGCKELAYFRAGQYISVMLSFEGAFMCKPYSLCSAPKDALGSENNRYAITVKRNEQGYASDYILDNWKVGTPVVCSGPLGEFYHNPLRDSRNVVALAGGSGITPFLSMARAIADGTEDFNLTILYGSKNHNAILLLKELTEAEERSGGKVKIINVISDDNAEGFEHGFISADLIRKYAPGDDYSVFVCGPKAMYDFMKKELAKLQLPKRRVRFELAGEYGDPTGDAAYPKASSGKTFKVTVLQRGKTRTVSCKSEETLLHAMETAGIQVLSDCRSGQCGWCHSRLIKGEIYVPESHDGRRAADKKFGWIHPCATYPLSDIELEVFPLSVKE